MLASVKQKKILDILYEKEEECRCDINMAKERLNDVDVGSHEMLSEFQEFLMNFPNYCLSFYMINDLSKAISKFELNAFDGVQWLETRLTFIEKKFLSDNFDGSPALLTLDKGEPTLFGKATAHIELQALIKLRHLYIQLIQIWDEE